VTLCIGLKIERQLNTSIKAERIVMEDIGAGPFESKEIEIWIHRQNLKGLQAPTSLMNF